MDFEKEVHDDSKRIINEGAIHFPENSFQNLLRKEQKRVFCNSSMTPYYDKVCFTFSPKILTAHEALNGSSIIKFPSEKTLTDYSSIFHPNASFQLEVC